MIHAINHTERSRAEDCEFSLTSDETPLERKKHMASQEDDEETLQDFPMLCPPVHMDYGYNVKYVTITHFPASAISIMFIGLILYRLGSNVFVNQNSTWIDTCKITVGARTLIGPNCAFYSGTHPLDPSIRNGTRGPETGKPINIGEDCWLGGNVIVLPGITIGKGSTVGAGSVVTKDVEPYTCVAGNPARFIRKIEVTPVNTAPVHEGGGVEVLTGEEAPKVEAGFLEEVVEYIKRDSESDTESEK